MSDVLSNIKAKRSRATVPPREDLLLSQSPASEIAKDAQTKSTTSSTGGQIEVLRAELEKYPEIIRHSAIRLEKDLDSRLTRFCKENGFTIETFLEAAFEEVQADTQLREGVLANARNRYASRKKAGKLRAIITQLEKARLPEI